ncbi:hypothetical protein FCM35_KLT19165 [Carex littledalei]|uniref:KIB1-4 beta-propeller domain-containing protein n=1 Tax=Carex littledalei TaxID=544730 RepID=A0A833R7H0_9POAL|nr:hypothetical protein FCM35_KLT19165 [Carex littledalei]
MFYGQSHGYLVTFKIGLKDLSLTLLNPFTRAEVPLPFHWFKCFRPLHVGADPFRNSDDVVIYMNESYERHFVGFWKNEDNGWSLKGSFPSRAEAYNRGRLFCSNLENCSTTIIDLTTGNKLEVRLPYNDFRRHYIYCLGEGAGAFLGIQRHFHSCTKDEYLLVEKCWFEVYQLVEEQSPPRWVKLSDMGNLIIFLNFDKTGFCLSASDFDGIKGNCIYFTWRDEGRSLIGRYELGKHGSEEFCQLESGGIWIVPNVY